MATDAHKKGWLRCLAPRLNSKGQTAMVLILLAAAALIFYAITVNWGRIAQVKSFLTMAADESASQLASESASYGEMQKQTYLHDVNQKVETTSVVMSLIVIVLAVIISILCWGTCSAVVMGLAIAAVVMSVASLILQVVVIQPGITSMWNKLQQNQPIQQQLFEAGIQTALQASVTDQVKFTDIFDLNTNGVFGVKNNSSQDTLGRFALFYTERLKILNNADTPNNPYVQLFLNGLNELMNGETCGENAADYNLKLGIPIDPRCQQPATDLDCVHNPNPACNLRIPNSLPLNDSCMWSSDNAQTATYSPYCDPCCVPVCEDGSACGAPSSCLDGSSCAGGQCADGSSCGVSTPGLCADQSKCNNRPAYCDQSPTPAQCLTNNPYGAPYYYLFDPSFQNYANNDAFLAQFGRDQQTTPFTNLIQPNVLNPAASLVFPNGIYPFFWMLKDYSLQIDNIDPTGASFVPAQFHWCSNSVTPGYTPPVGFQDLVQLDQPPYKLPFTCSGADCCVNKIDNSVSSSGPPVVSAPLVITLTSGLTIHWTNLAQTYFTLGPTGSVSVTLTADASENNGLVVSAAIWDAGNGSLVKNFTFAPVSDYVLSTTLTFTKNGTYKYVATATDSNNRAAQTLLPAVINVIAAPTVTITAPGSGTNLVHNATVGITVSTTVSAGDSIASVTFYNNGAPIGSSGSGPFSFVWTVPNTAGAAYKLTAVATDANGLQSAPSAAVIGNIT